MFLISRTRGFAFFHVPKTGGTSLAGVLGLYAAAPAVRNKPKERYLKGVLAEGLPDAVLDLPVHATWRDAETCLGRDVLDAVFSFGFVRNPFDLEVSWYTYSVQNPSFAGHKEAVAAKTFKAWLKDIAPKREALAFGFQQAHLCDARGALAVSYVGRYETFEQDATHVLETLDLPADDLPHFNQSYHEPWQTAYDDESADLVRRIHKRDFDAFGYSQEL